VIWSVTVLPATELDSRGRRLRAALAAVLVRDRARELDLVHQGSIPGPVSAWSSPA
jgi:hypothetical protein